MFGKVITVANNTDVSTNITNRWIDTIKRRHKDIALAEALGHIEFDPTDSATSRKSEIRQLQIEWYSALLGTALRCIELRTEPSFNAPRLITLFLIQKGLIAQTILIPRIANGAMLKDVLASYRKSSTAIFAKIFRVSLSPPNAIKSLLFPHLFRIASFSLCISETLHFIF